VQQRNTRTRIVLILVSVGCVYAPIGSAAKDPSPRIRHETHKPFQAFADDLLTAIRQHNMGPVCRVNAQTGAASRGVKIPGKQVFMIFRDLRWPRPDHPWLRPLSHGVRQVRPLR